jgi:UDP-2-acetamido-3-amino-2,3-dideoxy-glucuronate N-acetyltransferase
MRYTCPTVNLEMVFTSVYNRRAEIRKMDQLRPTLVKKGATIGANATVVCGVALGRYAFIGTGTAVNKDIQDYALVTGNPAKQLGWMCECCERLSDDLDCQDCRKEYEKKGVTIILKPILSNSMDAQRAAIPNQEL